MFDFLAGLADVIGDLLDGSDTTSATDVGTAPSTHASDLHFGGGGRWEGTDQWGNPVQQSSLGPPTNSNTGATVDPNNVTWNK